MAPHDDGVAQLPAAARGPTAAAVRFVARHSRRRHCSAPARQAPAQLGFHSRGLRSRSTSLRRRLGRWHTPFLKRPAPRRPRRRRAYRSATPESLTGVAHTGQLMPGRSYPHRRGLHRRDRRRRCPNHPRLRRMRPVTRSWGRHLDPVPVTIVVVAVVAERLGRLENSGLDTHSGRLGNSGCHHRPNRRTPPTRMRRSGMRWSWQPDTARRRRCTRRHIGPGPAQTKLPVTLPAQTHPVSDTRRYQHNATSMGSVESSRPLLQTKRARAEATTPSTRRRWWRP